LLPTTTRITASETKKETKKRNEKERPKRRAACAIFLLIRSGTRSINSHITAPKMPLAQLVQGKQKNRTTNADTTAAIL
jgi:hypothetical protein